MAKAKQPVRRTTSTNVTQKYILVTIAYSIDTYDKLLTVI